MQNLKINTCSASLLSLCLAAGASATTSKFDFGYSADSDAFKETGWNQFELPTTIANPQTSDPDPVTGWTITLTRTDGTTIGGRNRDPFDATISGSFTLDNVYVDFIVSWELMAINNLDPAKTYDFQLIMFDDNTSDGRTQTVYNITDGANDLLGTSDGPGIGLNGTLDSNLAYSVFATDLSPDASGVITFRYENTFTGVRSLTNGVVITENDAFAAADLDQDGDVDDADFGIAFAAFTGPNNGPSGNPAADLDGDNDVDDADFGLAFAAFTGPGGASAVPEPSSLALLSLGGLAAVRRRNRS